MRRRAGGKLLEVWRLGRMEYEQALVRLERLVSDREAGRIGDTLLSLEHPAIFTMGKAKKKVSLNLLTPIDQLNRLGLQLYHSNRQGDITFHGPGQAVLYGIVSLPELGISVDQYVEGLEATMVNVAKSHGLAADATIPYGCWVAGKRFIGALGIDVSAAGVTSHGLAFNMNTDLSFYEHIVPCGIYGKPATSLAQEIGGPVDEEAVRQQLVESFAEVFGYWTLVFKGLGLKRKKEPSL